MTERQRQTDIYIILSERQRQRGIDGVRDRDKERDLEGMRVTDRYGVSERQRQTE